jgi:hypothetical protein
MCHIHTLTAANVSPEDEEMSKQISIKPLNRVVKFYFIKFKKKYKHKFLNVLKSNHTIIL